MTKILAADIGGTNSRFAHFETGEGGVLELRGTCWLGTKESSSFGGLMDNLRRTDFALSPEQADIAVFAVAGPVERGGVYSNPPYIDWDIDISAPGEFGLGHAVLVNDFVAQAWAAVSPVGQAAREILGGEADPAGAVAVIGAGTGLGMAALVPDGAGGYSAMPSEGGHQAFPLLTKEECELGRFVTKDTGDAYPTGNTVVSGGGLSRIHEFLTGERLKPGEVADRLDGFPDTLSWMARLYGRACRDFALATLATGGLYIAGGVAARVPAMVEHEAFGAEFRSSPKMAAVLSRIPVRLITDQESGLWGAAMCGLKMLKKAPGRKVVG
jgi:glucokinase